MIDNTKTYVINTANSATQTIPEAVEQVELVVGLAGGATSISATTYTVVSGSPSAGQVQFTGAPGSPSNTLTFESALAANGLLLVMAVPIGAVRTSY